MTIRPVDLAKAKQAHPRRTQMVRLWLAGSTYEEIGEVFGGISKQRVHAIITDILGEHGYSRARRGDIELIPRIVRLMDERIKKMEKETCDF